MLIRLAVLVAAEIAAVVFLGFQVAASPGTASLVPGHALPAGTKEGPQEPTADVAPKAPTQGPAKAPEVAQRTESVAKWNAEDPVGILLCGTVRWADGRVVAEPLLSCKLGARWADASGTATKRSIKLTHEGAVLTVP